MRAAPVIGFTHPKSHLIFIVIFILTSPRKKSVKCVQIFSICDHVVTRRWYTEYKSVTESPKFDTLRRNTMETNRMMSPAARRLAAVVLAALLCLSLFWPRGGSLTAVLCGAPLASVNGRPAAQVMAVQGEQ